MNARIYYDRSLHALTSSLAMLAQRLPFIKNLCPLLTSPATLKVATPMAVTFVGTDSLSGQTIMIVPVDGYTNPANAQLGEEFDWVFTTNRFQMQDATAEGLPDGLELEVGTGLERGFSRIFGTPTEAGQFTISLVAWRFPNLGGENSQTYSLTLNVDGGADPFTAWRELNWKGTELDDLAVSGPNADPDKDGLENLLEFVLDLDPRAPSQMPGEFMIDPDDENQFRYEIPLNAEAAETNVTFQQNSTLDPAKWTNVSEAGIIRTNSKIVLSIPKAPGRKFYRLRVVL
ncbi:hypothetical protein N9A94_02585 [Akkermansiaceae bacterium]|nr:hypothetical protein [Akkermansiaceae bacterium]MDB4537101.1 hypothetical protein [Akkermansiaceae bacterium]